MLDFSDLDYFLDGNSLPIIVILTWNTNDAIMGLQWSVQGIICG
jgi:hypothetical protein